MRKLKLALAQLRSALGETEENVRRIESAVEEASRQRVDYIVFPELFVTGFTLNERLKHLSESIDGKAMKRIGQCAKQFGVGIFVGFPEEDDGKYYNAAALFSKNGKLIGTYRKVHLYDTEREWFTPGETLEPLVADGIKFGVGITYDMEFPEVARTLALQSIDVYIVLAANMVPYQLFQRVFSQSRALENDLPVAVSNMVGLDRENVYFGESVVVSRAGEILGRGTNDEQLLVVDVDLDETSRAQKTLNYLEERRSEVYRL